jgi:organic radical activating enzyme/predicted HNH restriction endonuclease
MQGEGRYSGKMAFFIRFTSCNLSCPFCFGIKKGRRAPRLRLADGGAVRIDKVKEGQKILTFDDDFNIVETTINQTMKREVTSWHEIKINGVDYFVTPEHPFFTSRGIIQAQHLIPGDQVFEIKSSDIASFKMMGERNPMKDTSVALRKAANTDYKEVGRKNKIAIQKKKDSGIYKSVWQLLSSEKKEEVRKKLSDGKLGERNPQYIKDHPMRNFAITKTEISKGSRVCEICGAKRSTDKTAIEVHHIDENHYNDSVDNIVVVCHKCHSQIHQRGYNFWNGSRRDKKQLVSAVAHNGKEVQGNKFVNLEENKYFGRPYGPKPLTVYNISCSPYNTYLIDNMWVHNCDTPFKDVHYDIEGKELALMILSKINEFEFVVLTGGEPTLELELESLCEELKFWDIPVHIETNGTNPEKLARIRDNVKWITVSPKLPDHDKTAESIIEWADEVKFIYTEEKLWENYMLDLAESKALKYMQPCSENFAPAIDFIKYHPDWTISVQLHKILKLK